MHRPRPVLISRLLAGLTVIALVAACGVGSGQSPTASGPGSPKPDAVPTRLVVGLGYIPSVQFAQFYLAQQEGLYERAGLDVEFQNKIDPDLIALVGQGAIDVGIGDGTSVIPAVSNGIPIRYVATIYGKFPNVVFAKATSGIAGAADLAGRKVGTPGRYGSGWIMLQALLASAGLTTDDVEIVEYPDFTQELAIEQDAVDAATGFANNEPVQLELNGASASVLRIDDITPLPGPGLVASVDTLDAKGDAIAAFIAATLAAMAEITDDPQKGLDAAIAAVPELASAVGQREVLAATIDSWTGPIQEATGLGAIDRDGWVASIAYLDSLGLVNDPITVDDLVRSELLPTPD